ncbi:MAG: diaminopimelate decarboxylase [Oscillospiraceae bacterium]|jgi:diaminopimelate decarboxylase|nr:diaminopimelate decarboxylase [Oscillospiraceae bacterium]
MERLSNEGRLTLGGADVAALAAVYGTPLYLMDEDAIRQNCRAFASALADAYPGDGHVAYASKAFCCTQMARILKEEGLLGDVASGGELLTVLKGGVSPDGIIFHGNNKTEGELRYAIENRIRRIVVNGPEELSMISRIAGELSATASVSIRLSPGITIDAHSAVQTSKLDSKFGVPIETGGAMDAVKLALSLPNLFLAGIHCHLGSPVTETEPYRMAADIMLEFSAKVRDELGVTLGELNLGGGFAAQYLPEQTVKPIEEYVSVIAEAVQAAAKRHKLPLPELVIEPGRRIVADAGLTVYTVGSVKVIPGVRTYVSVDGGLPDNPRYMLYGSKYTITLPERASELKTETIALAGRCCENELLGIDMRIQPVKPGDKLAVLHTGAYNYSMASHYNRVPKPPVVMLRGGKPFVAVRRETWEDVSDRDV